MFSDRLTMSTPQQPLLIPETAPFTPEQRAWLNGYIAGLLARGGTPPLATPRPSLLVLFGSQTGGAEALARKAAKEAAQHGFEATARDMATTSLAELAAVERALVIVSTYGDGEPPDSAKALHGALLAATASAQLSKLRYAVFALGDKNYTQFCRCGQDFDTHLGRLGATRAGALEQIDGDPAPRFPAWLAATCAALRPGGPPAAASLTNAKAAVEPEAPSASPGTRANPWKAPVLAVRRLSSPTSAKEVNHIEFDLTGSGLSYQPGDALGVVPRNDPELVAAVVGHLGCDGEEEVPAPSGGTTSLRHALDELYDLGRAGPELVALAPNGVLSTEPTPPHVLDILATGVKPRPADFVSLLRKLQPRLYSIASSQKAHPNAVHLTVGAVRYTAHGRARKGVCSTFLAERALALGHACVFFHHNNAFRLPADPKTPVIMIGPGTGIAPFTAFLEERAASGATGKNWLFFGDQREADDFLYRDELLRWKQDGLLTRLDLAWSRDQGHKVYVQHRMAEQANKLWSWLEAGAHVYVCGDASRMAKDVEAALAQVIATAGARSPEATAEYLAALRAAKRYQRDVY